MKNKARQNVRNKAISLFITKSAKWNYNIIIFTKYKVSIIKEINISFLFPT